MKAMKINKQVQRKTCIESNLDPEAKHPKQEDSKPKGGLTVGKIAV